MIIQLDACLWGMSAGLMGVLVALCYGSGLKPIKSVVMTCSMLPLLVLVVSFVYLMFAIFCVANLFLVMPEVRMISYFPC